MAERTQVSEIVQIGVETTLGTPVAANRFLPSLKINTGLDGSFTEVIPSGNKFPTQEVIGKEWTTASLEGSPTYDEMTYLLASLFDKATPVDELDDAYTWVFSPSVSAEDTIASFTIEQGSGVRAHKYSGAIVTELGLSGNRDEISLSGAIMGQLLSDGITLTAAPTAVPQVPIFPKDVSIFMDSAHGSLGTTKLGRAFSWEWTVNAVRGPLWVVDRDADSWVVPVEQVVDSTLSLVLEANAAGMALLSSMRNATTQFIRVEAISDTDAGTTPTPYSFTLDFAGQIASVPGEFSDEDGVVAISWEFKNVYSPAWGKAVELTLVNTTASL